MAVMNWEVGTKTLRVRNSTTSRRQAARITLLKGGSLSLSVSVFVAVSADSFCFITFFPCQNSGNYSSRHCKGDSSQITQPLGWQLTHV
eukprot:766482-Hanusia_phi.AAC.9